MSSVGIIKALKDLSFYFLCIKNLCIQKHFPGGVLKTGVLKNVTKFTGKPLCLSIFVSKVASLRPELNCSPEAYLELRQTFVKYDNTSGTFDVDYKI